MDEDDIIRDAKSLRDLYGSPRDAAIAKQVDYLHPLYQEFIRASPFVILASLRSRMSGRSCYRIGAATIALTASRRAALSHPRRQRDDPRERDG
jgi:predicted pyridoxine 5'-phosphate oxidase superfamily flavin-nucleotide-binding protein